MDALPSDMRDLVLKQRALQDKISQLEAMDVTLASDAFGDSLNLGESMSSERRQVGRSAHSAAGARDGAGRGTGAFQGVVGVRCAVYECGNRCLWLVKMWWLLRQKMSLCARVRA